MVFEVGSAVARLKADFSGFKQGIADAKSEASGLGTTMGNIGASFATFGTQAMVFTGVVAGAIGLAGKIGLDTAGKFEQYQIAFTTLLKSQDAASAAILQIQKDAAATPFEMQPLVMGNQRLISAGVSAKQARVDILNLGNAISATGGGNAELERLSTNLQQIKAVGKASALDIKQFAFAGINVYKMLSDSMGLNVDQIKNMDISYDDLTKAFAKAAGKGGMFEDAMAKQSTTLNGLLSTLHDTITIGLKDILMKSGLFDTIRDSVASLIPFLTNTAVPAIVNAFKSIGAVVSGFIELVQTDDMGHLQEALTNLGAPQLIEPLRLIGVMFEHFGEWIAANQQLVITFLEGLGIALGTLLVIGTITALITAFANPLVLAALAIAALYTAYQTNFMGIRDIVGVVVTEVAGFFTNYLMPAINAVVAYWVDRWGFVSLMLKGSWDMIVGIIQIAWSIIYGLIKIGLALIAGDWGAAWAAIVQMTSGAWEGVKKLFGGALEYIKGWGGMMVDNLVKPFQDAWNKISDLAQKIKDAMDPNKRHSPSMVDLVRNGVDDLNSAWDNLNIPMPGVHAAMPMAAGIGNAGGSNIALHINMEGAIIADEYSAQRMSETIGDLIIDKLKQNIRF